MNEYEDNRFVRINKVIAHPMTRGEYNSLRKIAATEDMNLDEQGFMVTYADGYYSWCPKDRFDAVSVPCKDSISVPFGYAMMMCQFFGKKIQRKGWNGDSQFVRFESVLAFEDGRISENPEDAKGAIESEAFVFHFKNRNTGETGVQVGWLASQADLKANDWVILD